MLMTSGTITAQTTPQTQQPMSLYVQPGGFIAVTNCDDKKPGITLTGDGKIVLLGKGAHIKSKGCTNFAGKVVNDQGEQMPGTHYMPSIRKIPYKTN